MVNQVDIVIPSYNGRQLLELHLPDVIKFTPNLNKLIIIEDGGDDDTSFFLKTQYPQATLIRNPHNLGFTNSVINGIALCSAPNIVLINNDVSPQKNYLKSSLSLLSKPKVFAVSFSEEQHSWPDVFWDNGKLGFKEGERVTSPHYSAWASGGSCVFSREIYGQLGGFNPVYSPGYWEDIDLGWRAWRTGYKIIWDPYSLVHHQHESTFNKLNQSYINRIKQRNELLFTWLNITDPDLVTSHRRFLAKHILTHPGYLKVFLSALALTRKSPTQPLPRLLTDKQVLSLINRPV